MTKSERTKAAVLKAAGRLFAESGYDATSLDAIGDEVGMRGTAILYHFATKRGLYESVLEQMFAPMIADMHRQLASDRPLADRCSDITSTVVRAAAAQPHVARMILREASSGRSDGSLIVGEASRHQWDRFLQALDEASGSDVVPRVLWNVLLGAIAFHFGVGQAVGATGGDVTNPERVREFEDVMVQLTRVMCETATTEVR